MSINPKDADIILDAFAKNMDMKIKTMQVGETVHVSVSYIPLVVETDAHGNIIVKQYAINDIEEVEL